MRILSNHDAGRRRALIVVDSSVWIDHFRGDTDRPHVQALRGAVERCETVIVGETVDLIIGTFCIDRGYRLLHNDRDFDPMHEHLGLRLAS